MFLRNIITISVITLSPCLLAATEFPNGVIPAEIANEFSSGKIYSSLPDNFPAPVLPAGTQLFVLGSVDNGFGQEVLLGTPLSGGEVRDILKAGYAQNGWIDLSRSSNILQLCHDVHGSLTFQLRPPIGAENRIQVQRSQRMFAMETGTTCAQELDYQNGGPARTPFQVFRESIPMLEMPAGTVNPGPLLPGGISSTGSSGSSYFRSQLDRGAAIPDYSLEELQQFLGQQMTEDGWALDGDFVGSKSASSVWFKTVEVPVPDHDVTGIPAGIVTTLLLTAEMTLLDQGEDAYLISLRVTQGDPSGGTIGIRGI
jgi:hypothetical protein